MKKALSILIAVILTLTLMCQTTVFAESAPPTEVDETPIEVDVAEAEDVPVDGSFTLTDDGEPVLEVKRQNELAVTGAFDGTMMNGFYTADFVMPDTGYNVFLTGLTQNNVEQIKQAIIDNYVEGKLFEMKNLGFIDVEKTYYGEDSLMCGPAAASNMLVGSGWAAQAGFTNSDDLFERFVDAFPNQGTAEKTVISWFFSGVAENWEYDSPGFGGYFPQYDCFDMIKGYDFDEETEAIYNRLREGYTASIGLTLYRFEDHGWFGGHIVTLWGFVTDPNYPADSKEHYKYIFVTDSDSNLPKKGKDRRTAPDVMSMIPIEYKNLYKKGWYYWYSDPPVCDVSISKAYVLKPYSPDIPFETSPDATLDKSTSPDAAIYDLKLTDEPKDEERFDELDHEEVISDPNFWSDDYDPCEKHYWDIKKSKTEFSNDATIYFCPYLRNQSAVDYFNQEEGISTRLTVTDAQEEVVLQKSYALPNSIRIPTTDYYSGYLFYSFKAQLPPGDYTATVEVNPNHTVPEALYINNTKSVDFKVRGTAYRVGDVDNNDTVDIIDATLIMRSSAGIKTKLDDLAAYRGDVNGDGDMDVIDATLIQRYLVNIPDRYGIDTVRYYT